MKNISKLLFGALAVLLTTLPMLRADDSMANPYDGLPQSAWYQPGDHEHGHYNPTQVFVPNSDCVVIFAQPDSDLWNDFVPCAERLKEEVDDYTPPEHLEATIEEFGDYIPPLEIPAIDPINPLD